MIRKYMKRVLITGATDGIGKAIAEALATKDVELFLFGRSTEKFEKINSSNIVKKYAFDLRDEEALYAALKDVNEKGGVDVLINNAGVNFRKANVLDIDIKELKDMMMINTISHLICMQETVPHMVEQGDGLVINILSSSCLYINPTMGAYSATKRATEAFTKTLVKEVKDQGVKVCDIYPGGVDTNFREAVKPQYIRPETIAKHVVYIMENSDDGMIQDFVTRPVCESNY